MRNNYCNLCCYHFFVIPCFSLMFLSKLFASLLLKMFGIHEHNTCICICSWNEVFIGLQHSTVASTVDASSTGCTTCQRGSFSQIASRIGKLVAVKLLLHTVHCLVPEFYAWCSLQNHRFKLCFFLANSSKNGQGKICQQGLCYIVGNHTQHPEIKHVIQDQRVKLGYNKYRLTPVSVGNTFQDLQRLREIAGNTKHYI